MAAREGYLDRGLKGEKGLSDYANRLAENPNAPTEVLQGVWGMQPIQSDLSRTKGALSGAKEDLAILQMEVDGTFEAVQEAQKRLDGMKQMWSRGEPHGSLRQADATLQEAMRMHQQAQSRLQAAEGGGWGLGSNIDALTRRKEAYDPLLDKLAKNQQNLDPNIKPYLSLGQQAAAILPIAGKRIAGNWEAASPLQKVAYAGAGAGAVGYAGKRLLQGIGSAASGPSNAWMDYMLGQGQ
jgi:hypothetical protein